MTTSTRDEPSAEALEIVRESAWVEHELPCVGLTLCHCGAWDDAAAALDAFANAAVEASEASRAAALHNLGVCNRERDELRVQVGKQAALVSKYSNEAHELREKLAEAQQKLKWIDEVPRAQHPDDERPWAAEMIRAKSALAERERKTDDAG